MSLRAVLGQETVVTQLERALRDDRLHHAYRFEGPEGVGKELAAIGLAMALLCTERKPLGCGECNACRRVRTQSAEPPHIPLHPDVIVIERGLYPESTLGTDEKTAISVEQLRKLVLARAHFPPAEGLARVFLVRRAEEFSVAAANALLKTLEEPRPRTHFVLLTARPDKLLPTIRSRTVPLRFRPLAVDVLCGLLVQQGTDPTVARHAAEMADGTMEDALALADPDRTQAAVAFVTAALTAARDRSPGAAVRFGEQAGKDREHTKQQISDLGRFLARAGRQPGDAFVQRICAESYELVTRAITQLEENAAPGHVLTHLALQLGALHAGELELPAGPS